ncbi:hypothetical protein, partial [Escherichia coli]|uniref:hypothetical protein n=1 Tax=Escherichia coli TaxID=562 RepID=UPI00289BF97B
VWVLCSTSLSPVGDLGYLAVDQIAQPGLSSLQVIYYLEQLFRKLFGHLVKGDQKLTILMPSHQRDTQTPH